MCLVNFHWLSDPGPIRRLSVNFKLPCFQQAKPYEEYAAPLQLHRFV